MDNKELAAELVKLAGKIVEAGPFGEGGPPVPPWARQQQQAQDTPTRKIFKAHLRAACKEAKIRIAAPDVLDMILDDLFEHVVDGVLVSSDE